MITVKQKNEVIRYGAGFCFILLAIYSQIYGFGLFHCISYGLIALSLFIGVPLIGTIGSGLGTLDSAYLLIRVIVYSFQDSSLWWYSCENLLNLVLFGLFLTITLCRRYKKRFGIMASVVASVEVLLNIISYWEYYIRWFSLPTDILMPIIYILCPILLGASYENMPKYPKKQTCQPPISKKLDKLEGLQKLLEQNIITQEEFEEKKKQLLNL